MVCANNNALIMIDTNRVDKVLPFLKTEAYTYLSSKMSLLTRKDDKTNCSANSLIYSLMKISNT